ncbi:MAG: sulfotransferase domain-containing protein [Candidatus Thermoplasmatota archaeon]|nr:sulfotransferase domain-containing protein [Candidatus Thermoplasmatota archaeon]MBU1941640.1 sulfotransferase domain-containing protein [Candidatus Thermoplasmatota archaeon]
MVVSLDTTTNYIVSGLERSGTSLLMQMLHAANLPVAFDDTRQPDPNNPKGYFELEGGKIINQLMKGTFPFPKYTGSFIKITAYGLKYLPPGTYKIIYSERNIQEILDSMEKMAEITDTNREETKQSFLRLNTMIKKSITHRTDCKTILVNYNHIIQNPEPNIKKICAFLELSQENAHQMLSCIDSKLYRNRRITKTF